MAYVCGTDERIGDTDPKLYVNCWPSWTGGNWKATRSVPLNPSSATETGKGSSPPKGGKLAGIIIGVILGLAVLVAIGVFAAKIYIRQKKTLVLLEGRAKVEGQDGKEDGTDKEVAKDVAREETKLLRPDKVRPSFVGNALLGNGLLGRKNDLRNDSVGTMVSNETALGARSGGPARVSVSSQDEARGPLEVLGSREYPHELDVQRPEAARLAMGDQRVGTPYVDARESLA
jgi:hypothetical protein